MGPESLTLMYPVSLPKLPTIAMAPPIETSNYDGSGVARSDVSPKYVSSNRKPSTQTESVQYQDYSDMKFQRA